MIDLFLYILPLFLNIESSNLQQEINSANVFKADFSKWIPDVNLENNSHCIIFLTVLSLSIAFLIAGLLKIKKTSKNKS